MGDDLRVRPATDADTGAIMDLVKLGLGDGETRDTTYWHWKHHANPFGVSPCLLAEADGQLVGLRVFMRWEWQAGGRRIRSVRAVDTATHPGWRGRGIFTRLTLALVEQVRSDGTAFVFNTPNQLSRAGYLKMGWSVVGRPTVWIRPLRPVRLLRALTRRAVSEKGGGNDWSFAEAGELFRQPEFQRLLASQKSAEQRLRTPRTLAYLRWRYEQIPGPRYSAAWEFDGHHGAAVVFRPKQQGAVTELRICEVLATPGPPGAACARRVLRVVFAAARTEFAAAMAAPGTVERRVLARSGFLPALRAGPILTARPLRAGPAAPDVLDPSRWCVSIGDLELF